MIYLIIVVTICICVIIYFTTLTPSSNPTSTPFPFLFAAKSKVKTQKRSLPKKTKSPTNSSAPTFSAAQQKLKSQPNHAILGNKIVPIKKTTKSEGRTQASLQVGNKIVNAVLNNGIAVATGGDKPVSLPKVNISFENSEDKTSVHPNTLKSVKTHADYVISEYGKSYGFSNKPIKIIITSAAAQLASGSQAAGNTNMKTNTIKIPVSHITNFDDEIEEGKLNPKGNLAHEIFHAVQSNVGPSRWFKEAIANYMAHKLTGNYNGVFKPVTEVGEFAAMLDASQGKNTSNGKPDDKLAYKEGSAFIGYLDNKYPNSLPALFQHNFRDKNKKSFKSTYGKTQDQLWNDFQKAVTSGEYVPSTNTMNK